MKFISWNVNGLRACVQKGFLDFFHTIDADFFCIQESSYRKDRLIWICRATINTGITRKRKAIPAPQSSQKKNRFPWHMVSVWKNTTRKAA